MNKSKLKTPLRCPVRQHTDAVNISTRCKVRFPLFQKQRLVGLWRSILVKHLFTDPGEAVVWIIHLSLLGGVCWQDTLTLLRGNQCGYDGHQAAARLLLTWACLHVSTDLSVCVCFVCSYGLRPYVKWSGFWFADLSETVSTEGRRASGEM